MIETCSHCDRGEHVLCCGLIDGTGGIEFDCECPCQNKYRDTTKTVCPDCGDSYATYRPDCHSMSPGGWGELLKESDQEEWDQYQKEQKEEQMQDLVVAGTKSAAEQTFPFTLEQLAYWVVKRKDGVTVKYTIVGPGDRLGSQRLAAQASSTGNTQLITTKAISAWCHHDPKTDPVWESGKVGIWIADSPGCKAFAHHFDYILDCGDILNLFTFGKGGKLEGDQGLIGVLSPFVVGAQPVPKVIQIDWDDRKAPPLAVDAWAHLAGYFKKQGGRVLTACQGGHGRSGTSLVCLMMALNPEYTPYDAIVHLRATHCPRAIESKEQHAYINQVGLELGREGNVAKVEGVKSFHDAFLALTLKSAKKYQERLTKTGK